MGTAPQPEGEQSAAAANARAWGIRVLAATSVLLVLMVGATGYLWLRSNSPSEEIATEIPSIGGPFTLINGEGKPVTDGDFRGKYMLVYFGYTFCPDVCPTTLAKMAAALDKLGESGKRIQPLFVTVDPKRDTPSVIGPFAAALSPRLIGLTGSPEQISTVEKEYRVYAAEHRTGGGQNDYIMDHSSIVYLMGADGHFVAVIRADADADVMAADIAKHLS